MMDPNKLSKAMRTRLHEIGMFRHIRVKGGYRIPGQAGLIKLATIEKLEALGLVRQANRYGRKTVEVTGAGKNLLDIQNQRDLDNRRAAKAGHLPAGAAA